MPDIWTIGSTPAQSAQPEVKPAPAVPLQATTPPATVPAAPDAPFTPPTYDASVALRRIFPGVNPTSQMRTRDDPLSIKNPDSNHIDRWDTIDVAPMEGVSYEDFLKRFTDAGYVLGETRNEVTDPIPGLTTGPHWHVQILSGPEGLTEEGDAGGSEWSIGTELVPPMQGEAPAAPYDSEHPDFRGVANSTADGPEAKYGERLFEDTQRPLHLNQAQTAHFDDYIANVLNSGGNITPDQLITRWNEVAALSGEDGEQNPGTLHNAKALADWMNENRQVISAATGQRLQPAIAQAPTGEGMDAFAEEPDDSWLTRQAKAVSRSVVESAQYAAPGWLGANLAYYQGNGFDQLKKLYPDATDEELNDVYWEAINGLQHNLRDTHDERLQDDSIAPWLVGQLVAGLGDPLNLVPLGKAATTLKELGGQVVAGGALNAVGDAVWQGADIARGVEDEYSIGQTALAAGIGAGATGLLGGLKMGGKSAPTGEDIDIAPPAAGQAPPGPLPGLGQQPPVTPFTPSAPDNTPPGLLREDLLASSSLRDPKTLASQGTADPALRAEVPPEAPTPEGAPASPRASEADPETGRKPYSNQAYTVEETRQHVDTLTAGWKNKPEFEIVDRLEDIADPEARQAMIDLEADGGTVYGFLGDKDDVVRIIAGRLLKPEDLKSVLFHESLGHFGLRAKYWKGLDNILGAALRTNEAFREAAEKWRSLNPQTYEALPEEDQLIRAAEEILAEDSEAGPITQTVRARLRANVRNMVRRVMSKDGSVGLNYTDADIDHILASAHRLVRKGGKAAQGAEEFMTVFRPMRAYQGGSSLHDKYDSQYLGSGEGAHVYGYGHYFAENKDTGRFYRQAVSRLNPERTVDGPLGMSRGGNTPLPLAHIIDEAVPNLHPYIKERMLEASNAPDRTRAIYKALDDILLWAGREYPDKADYAKRTALGRQAQETRRFLMNEALPSKGYLYEVELPDDTGHNYIDLDMKWRDAPRDVQQAIETSGIRISDLPEVVKGDTLQQIINIYGQEQIVRELLDAYRNSGNQTLEGVTSHAVGMEAKKAIARRLADRGFVGFKYLDQGSRKGKKGTSNRVVFNDADIEIKERYRGATEERIGPSDKSTPRPMRDGALNPTREAREEVARRTGLDGMAAVNRVRQERAGGPETPAEGSIRRASTLTSESSLADLQTAYEDLDQYRTGHGHRAEAQAEALQARIQHYMFNRPSPGYVPPVAPGTAVLRPMKVGESSVNTPEDSRAFRRAQAMDYSGRSGPEIFEATGWWRDDDGGWRRHMSDANSHVIPGSLIQPTGPSGKIIRRIPLKRVLHHPALYRAYPEIGDLMVEVDGKMKNRGGYSYQSNTIKINPNGPDPHSSLLHEIQHAIQQREGWSPGGNMKTHFKLSPEEQDASAALAQERGGGKPDLSDPIVVSYLRLLGEVEARATQRTREWSREQLNARGPTAGWDARPQDVLRPPANDTADSWDYDPKRVEEAAQANVAAAVLREVADDPTVAPSLEHFWDSMVRGKFPDVQQNTILNAGLRRYIPETSTMAPSDVLRELYVQAASTPNPQSISLDEVLESVSQEAVNLDRQAWTPTARPMLGSDGPRGRGRVQGASRREEPRRGDERKALGKYWSSKDIEGVMNENAPTYHKQEWDDWVEAANDIRRLSHGKIEERLRAVPEYAATMLAARHWLVGSANRIKDMSRMVDTEAWTPELDAQMQMEIARNVSMQEALAGAAGNGARAVNSFKILVGTSRGTNGGLLRAMSQGGDLAPNMLGEEGRKELARILRDTPDVETAQKYTKGSLDPRKADYLTSLWYAEVLSRPSTLFNNVVGTAESLIGETATDVLSAGIGSFQRAAGASASDVTTWREAAARLWGKTVGFKQAFTSLNALRAFQKGQPISGRATEAESLPWSALFDKKYDNADTSASRAIWKSLGLASRGVEFAPRSMAAIDEIFRSMAITSELYGRAAEDAVKKGLKGAEFSNHIAEKVKNPTPEDIKAATEKAQQVTYRDAPSPAGRAIEGLLGRSAKDSELDRAGKALLRTGLAPFIITPDSIIRTAIRHTPGLGFMDRYNKADWKSGPKGKARVMARMAFGLGVLGVYETLYQQGKLHTALEDDYRERNAVEIGALPGATDETDNDLLSLSNLGPFTLMGTMYATMRDGYDRGTMSGKDFATNMAEMAFLAASQALTNTWTEQPVGIVGAAESVRGGQGSSDVNNYWAGQAAAFLTPGILSSFNQAFIDPTYRSTGADTTGDAVRNRVKAGWPGYSQELPPQLDSAGDPLQRSGASGLGEAMAQFLLGNRVLRRPDDPASRAIQQQARDTRSDPIGRGSNTINFQGEKYKLTREERAQYEGTSSAYINDDLTALLDSGEWQSMTPDERKAALSEIKEGARKDARFDEFWNNPDWRGNTQ